MYDTCKEQTHDLFYPVMKFLTLCLSETDIHNVKQLTPLLTFAKCTFRALLRACPPELIELEKRTHAQVMALIEYGYSIISSSIRHVVIIA